MGCAASTAKRRRKQAVGGYKHLPPRERPNYPNHTAAVWDKRAAKAQEKRQTLQGRSKKKRK